MTEKQVCTDWLSLCNPHNNTCSFLTKSIAMSCQINLPDWVINVIMCNWNSSMIFNGLMCVIFVYHLHDKVV